MKMEILKELQKNKEENQEKIKKYIEEIATYNWKEEQKREKRERNKTMTERQIINEKVEQQKAENKAKQWKEKTIKIKNMRIELEKKLREKGRHIAEEKEKWGTKEKEKNWIQLIEEDINKMEQKKEIKAKNMKKNINDLLKNKTDEGKKIRKILTWNADSVGEKNIKELCRNLEHNKVELISKIEIFEKEAGKLDMILNKGKTELLTRENLNNDEKKAIQKEKFGIKDCDNEKNKYDKKKRKVPRSLY